MGLRLTNLEQKENISFLHRTRFSAGDPVMSDSKPLADNSRYEQACDQAIAMCDGNLRSTIKALIMANEYLEAELQDMQEAMSAALERLSRVKDSAA
jgi:hypothetical protein